MCCLEQFVVFLLQVDSIVIYNVILLLFSNHCSSSCDKYCVHVGVLISPICPSHTDLCLIFWKLTLNRSYSISFFYRLGHFLTAMHLNLTNFIPLLDIIPFSPSTKFMFTVLHDKIIFHCVLKFKLRGNGKMNWCWNFYVISLHFRNIIRQKYKILGRFCYITKTF